MITQHGLDSRFGEDDDNKQSPAVTFYVKFRLLCELWAGKGNIYRLDLFGTEMNGSRLPLFVIKHVTPPPHDPNSQSFGDRRKSDSYQVEANFYQKLAWTLRRKYCLQLPSPYFVERGPAMGEITICMSLLDGEPFCAGNMVHAKCALDWLARFHASHWSDPEEPPIQAVVKNLGLQTVGSYWHLDTRPEEHAKMSNRGWEKRLKLAARGLDSCLKRDPMQCLIHGDPKDENIIVLKKARGRTTRNEDEDVCVALYDFQYCGQSTPTRDLCYFLSTSTNKNDEEDLVNYYYWQLVKYLTEKRGSNSQPLPTCEHLKASLEVAFCDFTRFLLGWGHWGNNNQARVKSFLNKLDGGKMLGSEEAYDLAIRKLFW